MEGQPDVEQRNRDQMDCEREPEEEEWKSWQRGEVRNMLHIVSAAAQWILLLACLIYLACVKQPISKNTFFIMGSSLLSSIPGESIEQVAVNLTAEVGSIQIRNGSIMIASDGLYLVSLKGSVLFNDPDALKLTLQKTDNKTSKVLWE
ncbi:hypothetical protein Z169_13473, partial [Egretta garzetta]